ncbi:MAG: alpha/beta hydrolase [Pirellulaceae bacterium]|nr:alpha/beta hydrolase [Pirellulaceae bacterium]
MPRRLSSTVVFNGAAIACFLAASVTAQDRRTTPTFEGMEKNADGVRTRDEFPAALRRSFFDQIDANSDQRVTRAEDDAFRAKRRGRFGRQVARPEQKLPDQVKTHRDLVYATVGDRALPLDLYLPARAATPTPLVLWIHGGGWKGGTKNGSNPAMILLPRGYAVASVEYRLSGEAIFPAAIADCKAAVSFLRAHANKFNLDPDRFGVWGSSAGGHLAALIGTTGDTDEFETHAIAAQTSSQVQAVCDWFGPTDFLRMNDFKGSIDHDAAKSPESLFIGAPIQDNPSLVAKANPITYASKSDPPFLIMHGEVDDMVPYDQSVRLQKALRAVGVQSELVMIKGGNHGFRGADESREQLSSRSADFFDAILKDKQ